MSTSDSPLMAVGIIALSNFEPTYLNRPTRCRHRPLMVQGRVNGLATRPRSRAQLFAIELVLGMAPFILIRYMRYRSGAYRRHGCAWTTDSWNPKKVPP